MLCGRGMKGQVCQLAAYNTATSTDLAGKQPPRSEAVTQLMLSNQTAHVHSVVRNPNYSLKQSASHHQPTDVSSISEEVQCWWQVTPPFVYPVYAWRAAYRTQPCGRPCMTA